jgi:hypothetical protein
MPAQPQFSLPDEKPTEVLWEISTARTHLLGENEDSILELIEVGFVLWAWNIGRIGSREVRIWPSSVGHYKVTWGSRLETTTEAQILTAIHAALGGKPFTTGDRLRLVLNCSSSHVTNLLKAKLLTPVPGTKWGPGPTGSAIITWASVEQFLKSRRLA